MTGLETPRIGEAQARREALARFFITPESGMWGCDEVRCADCYTAVRLPDTWNLADAVDAADLHWQENHA